MINRKFFFDEVRWSLFGGSLTQAQVDGMSGVLDEWEENHRNDDDRWLAYMLATIFHEVAKRMQPIHEFGSDAYFFRMYDKDGERPAVAKALGNTHKGDGVKFHGRGFVQLTGRDNYKRMSKLLGVDLIKNPDDALKLDVATSILFIGMRDGVFTGHKLADYFNPMEEDWIEARRIINRLDRAEMIAGYGRKFYASISYTTG
ncbi:hypothetical protein [Bauldia litoralis]|uniref:Chitinase class I n=1 Tax=Bauldia litoralis TaxID=665467 RepID=A0A1G6D289_9HYPH|nr:hypothetical protein [Bauldia litoralis]SDB39287.1 Chitinase class I [Bauldia litoralis]